MLPSIQCHKRRTHEKLPHKILRLLVKTLGEVVFQLLDFLPISQPSEDESPSDHLIDDAAQCPKIRAIGPDHIASQ